MRRALAAALLLATSAPLAAGPRADDAARSATTAVWAASALPRSTPEAQGIPSSAILALVQAFEAKACGVHSLMVVRHGNVVAEGWWAPYAKNGPHVLYSLSKSFTSTAVGFAIAEGKLTLDDSVLAAFPEDAPAEAGENLQAMRLRDLLSMSTGHHAESIDGFPFGSAESLPRLFLALPVAHKPGTHFVYNTPATYMASAMVQKATGQSALEYLKPRLFDPLGIENPTWDADQHGVTLGGFGLRVRTEDIARFGQLYLQKGQWKGRQLLPSAWVEAATARQVSNGSNPKSDWEQGYGYQFWRCRHGLYRGDGAFGQYCIVMPGEDAVVAITSGTKDMGGVMSLVWEHLLPALQAAPLAADAGARDALARKLGGLVLPPQEGRETSPLAARLAGRRFVLAANDEKAESVALEIARGAVTLVSRGDGQETRVPVAYGRWGESAAMPVAGREAMPFARREERVSASGAWTADDTYTARLCLHETPFVLTVTLRFAGDEVMLDREWNVGFGETKRPRLVGRAEPGATRR